MSREPKEIELDMLLDRVDRHVDEIKKAGGTANVGQLTGVLGDIAQSLRLLYDSLGLSPDFYEEDL